MRERRSGGESSGRPRALADGHGAADPLGLEDQVAALEFENEHAKEELERARGELERTKRELIEAREGGRGLGLARGEAGEHQSVVPFPSGGLRLDEIRADIQATEQGVMQQIDQVARKGAPVGSVGGGDLRASGGTFLDMLRAAALVKVLLFFWSRLSVRCCAAAKCRRLLSEVAEDAERELAGASEGLSGVLGGELVHDVSCLLVHLHACEASAVVQGCQGEMAAADFVETHISITHGHGKSDRSLVGCSNDIDECHGVEDSAGRMPSDSRCSVRSVEVDSLSLGGGTSPEIEGWSHSSSDRGGLLRRQAEETLQLKESMLTLAASAEVANVAEREMGIETEHRDAGTQTTCEDRALCSVAVQHDEQWQGESVIFASPELRDSGVQCECSDCDAIENELQESESTALSAGRHMNRQYQSGALDNVPTQLLDDGLATFMAANFLMSKFQFQVKNDLLELSQNADGAHEATAAIASALKMLQVALASAGMDKSVLSLPDPLWNRTFESSPETPCQNLSKQHTSFTFCKTTNSSKANSPVPFCLSPGPSPCTPGSAKSPVYKFGELTYKGTQDDDRMLNQLTEDEQHLAAVLLAAREQRLRAEGAFLMEASPQCADVMVSDSSGEESEVGGMEFDGDLAAPMWDCAMLEDRVKSLREKEIVLRARHQSAMQELGGLRGEISAALHERSRVLAAIEVELNAAHSQLASSRLELGLLHVELGGIRTEALAERERLAAMKARRTDAERSFQRWKNCTEVAESGQVTPALQPSVTDRVDNAVITDDLCDAECEAPHKESDLLVKIDMLEKQYNDMQNELQSEQRSTIEIRAEHAAAMSRMELEATSLAEQLKKNQQDLQHAQEQAEEDRQGTDKLRKDKKRLADRVRALEGVEGELKVLEAKFHKSDAELKHWRAEAASLAQQLSSQKDACAHLTVLVSKKDSQLRGDGKMKDTAQQLWHQLKELETQLQGTSANLKDRQSTLQNVESQLSARQEELVVAHSEVTKKKDELQNVLNALQEASSRVANEEQTALQRKHEAQVAADEASHAEHNLQLILAELGNAQGQLKKSKNGCGDLHNELASLNGRSEQLRNVVATLHGEIESLRKKKGSLVDDIKKMEAKAEACKQRCDHLRLVADKFSSELEDVRSAVKQATTELQHRKCQVSDMEQKCGEAQARLELLSKQCTKVNKNLMMWTQQQEMARNACDKDERRRQEIERELQQAHSELIEVRREIEEVNGHRMNGHRCCHGQCAPSNDADSVYAIALTPQGHARPTNLGTQGSDVRVIEGDSAPSGRRRQQFDNSPGIGEEPGPARAHQWSIGTTCDLGTDQRHDQQVKSNPWYIMHHSLCSL
eukprot:evm.model.scf_39.13 EVM.evm.TU.scf_39.13   scf_39:130379-141742(-)